MLRLGKAAFLIAAIAALLQAGCTDFFPGLTQLIQDSTSQSAAAKLDQLIGSVPTDALRAVIVNQTGYRVELDIAADSVPYTFTCDPSAPGSFNIDFCPNQVTTLSERWIDSKGAVVGGRDYTGTGAFNFPPGSFSCGGAVIWRLSASSVSIDAL
jgi:hypothetical protein